MKIFPHLATLLPPFFFIFYFGDVFITGEAVMTHDSIMWYGVFNYFLLTLAEGYLPLWDPFSFSGTTFFTSFNSMGLLDPTVLLMVPFAVSGDFSALDLYHTYHLIKLLVYYWGVYFLCLYLSKKPIPSLCSAGLVFIITGTNSLRQNGSLLLFYIPWIILFLLQLFSPSISKTNRRLCFIAVCYLTGLSFNFFIPSYLFIFTCLLAIYFFVQLQFRPLRKFTLIEQPILVAKKVVQSAVFILLLFIIGYVSLEISGSIKLFIIPLLILLMLGWFFKQAYVLRILKFIGWKHGLSGLLLLSVLAAPFFCSLFEMLPQQSENFGYLRVEPLGVSNQLVHIANDSLFLPKEHFNASPHYLIRLLVPFTDLRYFMGLADLWEINFIVGIPPLLVCLLFYKGSRSPHKRLFLFLTSALFFLMVCPQGWFDTFFKYLPGYPSTRVLLAFSGFFYAVWAGLLSICMVGMGQFLKANQKKYAPSILWLLGLAFVHAEILYYYLTHFIAPASHKSVDLKIEWFEANLFQSMWFLWSTYLAIAIFLLVRFRSVRIICAGFLGGLTFFQVTDFVMHFEPLIVQPSVYAKAPEIHHRRSFKYQEVRVPGVPRLGPFWSYLAPMYRVPTAGPLFATDYFITGRRVFDLIRNVPAENYGLMAGVASKRYGFFDEYLVATDSMDALRLAKSIPAKTLQRVLILEDRGIVPLPVRPEITSDFKPEGFLGKKIAELYDFQINFGLSNFQKTQNQDELVLPSFAKYFKSDWPWDLDHLGFFHITNNYLVISNLNRVYFHNKIYSVIMGIDEKQTFCYSNKYLRAEILYGKDRVNDSDSRKSLCHLYVRDGNLVISKKHWRDEMERELSLGEDPSLTRSAFNFSTLSNDKVTPDHSPYGRDEATKVLDFGPNHIRFKMDNNKAGLFYYADSYSKHWKAWIDGEPAQVMRGNFNFKAVHVNSGEHIVEFRFEPVLFIFFMKAFIWISIPGLLIPAWAFYTNFIKKNCERGESFSQDTVRSKT
ncbi:MAG: hypothetical protein COV66_04615 [Nitrospinae bacterium CG11_big_fil_rev_8_21_14_0_20_45_15]|nr:MAG: hypothetical protein COV66_04615 [Nitrospinae bacterium CG11_big_fil_rev_8_21_14_0_20_45_15]